MFIPPDVQQELGRSAARLCKELTGRGPVSVQVDVVNDQVTICFRGFLSQLEESVLARTGRSSLVEELRECLREGCCKDWQNLFAQFGLKVRELAGETDLANNKRVIRVKVEPAC